MTQSKYQVNWHAKYENIFLFYSIPASSFKTGLEPGLICYQCVGTHPGCGLYDFDWKWYWGVTCPRSDDRCVKVRKGRTQEDLEEAKYAKIGKFNGYGK